MQSKLIIKDNFSILTQIIKSIIYRAKSNYQLKRVIAPKTIIIIPVLVNLG